jgi:hypothetical protein
MIPNQAAKPQHHHNLEAENHRKTHSPTPGVKVSGLPLDEALNCDTSQLVA